MLKEDINIIYALLSASAAFLIFPALIYILCRVKHSLKKDSNRKIAMNKLLIFSACLIGSIWCLRYAVGYYSIISAEGGMRLTKVEEIFNSMGHALQTFSMDEDYTEYIINGKMMIADIMGENTAWPTVYGIYASVLNFIAPVAGGAIIFEILAGIFPKLKLFLMNIAFFRVKYYFSELNNASVALAKDILNNSKKFFFKPVIVFTDAYTDKENEKSNELMNEAKSIGAICVRDDLIYTSKNKFGKRRFLLIDEDENKNLKHMAELASKPNIKYLKRTEVYIFAYNDAYINIEKSIRAKLERLAEYKKHFSEKNMPTFIPIRSYQNLVTNALVDVPLYEPLLKKHQNSDGTVNLTVTILGLGAIGTEMLLTTYWMGQMLDCNLTINVISRESEEAFKNKLDYINPEILCAARENDPILRIYPRKTGKNEQRDDMAKPYCNINYTQCDVESSEFTNKLDLDSDYYFVSLGSDADNISVANTIHRRVGAHHIDGTAEMWRENQKNNNKEKAYVSNKAVIAYVVYDDTISAVLNEKKCFSSYKNDINDIFMCAVGSLGSVYSVRNVFMTEYEPLVRSSYQSYLEMKRPHTEKKTDSESYIDKRISNQKKRIKNEYDYWSTLARSMHLKYRIYSVEKIRKNMMPIFEMHDDNDEEKAESARKYEESLLKTYDEYEKFINSNADEDILIAHKLAWLEHRRWNAFLRVSGYRHTDSYEVYVENLGRSYKQMDIKLHPCLVECDRNGIKGNLIKVGKVDTESLLKSKDKDKFDLLDDLSYSLYMKKYNNYDFKQYDYPDDMKLLHSIKRIIKKEKA